VQVSRGKMGGGAINKKKSKKYRKSSMKKRFSKKFRKSVMRKKQSKARKMSFRNKNKKSLHGGAAAATDTASRIPIPSFSQGKTPELISGLAGNHAQTLAYSEYDSQVGIVNTSK